MLLSLSFWEFLFLEDFRVILDESLWVEFQLGNNKRRDSNFLHFHLFLSYCFFVVVFMKVRWVDCIVCCTVDLWRLLIILKNNISCLDFSLLLKWMEGSRRLSTFQVKKKNCRGLLLYWIQNANQQVKNKTKRISLTNPERVKTTTRELFYII